MTSEMNPKFSAEELHGCKNWLLPDVSSDIILPSAEKEALEAKEKQKKRESKKGPLNQSAGESIEVVDESVAPVTAEQLQEITEAAEKEGFDSGYQQGLEKGLKEGKEKGEQQGYEEGMAKSKQTVAEQCEQLQHVIDALLIPLETEQKQLQDMILDMVSSLARAVVLRELQQDSSHITQLVDDALNLIPVGADKFSLYLNSQDIDIVEKHVEYFQHNDDKHLSLHIDDSLLPGGCRLETQQTVVDCTVEQRLQKVIEGFMHKRFANPNENKTEDETEAETKAAQPENEAGGIEPKVEAEKEEKRVDSTAQTGIKESQAGKEQQVEETTEEKRELKQEPIEEETKTAAEQKEKTDTADKEEKSD